MFRLTYSIMFLLPWWVYAFITVLLANASIGLWQAHDARTAQTEIAIRQGPPAVIKVGEFNPRMRDDPFQEIRIAGFLRADLGVGRIEGTVPKTYLVLDDADRTGALIAVMFVGSDDQAGLPELVATANDSGLVTASGFRRTLDRAEVSGQLRLQGVRREVVIMEAMVGDRADVLREKGARDLPFVIFVGALTIAAGLMALYRRSTSRKGKVKRFRKRTNLQAAVPKAAKIASVKTVPTQRNTAAAPWGATPPDARPTPSATPEGPRPVRSDLPSVPVIPPFKSVFPGAGSGFRFKTADEIIRQSFGTVTLLTPSMKKDK